MKKLRPRRIAALLLTSAGLFACGFDATLREYLDAHFWLPFSRHPSHFEKPGVQRASAPFAGMGENTGDTPIRRLRAAYKEISQPRPSAFDATQLRQWVAAARATANLSARDREEVELIEAKIDMRLAQPGATEQLTAARARFERFLSTARVPEFRSEARGWIAYLYYLEGNQTAAGKIYLDELNRNGSNLSRETVLTSLRVNYGYDGGPGLLQHLDEYFDTPEHAAFAIQLATNPQWSRSNDAMRSAVTGTTASAAFAQEAQAYERIRKLLDQHQDLLASQTGANALAVLNMRLALRMGDPESAIQVASQVPDNAAVRQDPHFLWMLASANFLTRQYAQAEPPLLALFQSKTAERSQKAAAAYGLCGVYERLKNPVEQLHYALWLANAVQPSDGDFLASSGLEDGSVYWAASGWDLAFLLDAEAPLDSLRTFAERYPGAQGIRKVQYALAVRLSREGRYEESAQIYQSIGANLRAARMRRLSALQAELERTDLPPAQQHRARYAKAEFLAANPERVFFNDTLWSGLQRYAIDGTARENRADKEQHAALLSANRTLQDSQEERWQAYLLLRGVADDEGKTDLGVRAAQLAIRCLRGINERFGRRAEIRKADIELSTWLRH
ncbi:MAG: hypothetical protein ABL995_08865 [Bryobacteraceae bacterium]